MSGGWATAATPTAARPQAINSRFIVTSGDLTSRVTIPSGSIEVSCESTNRSEHDACPDAAPARYP